MDMKERLMAIASKANARMEEAEASPPDPVEPEELDETGDKGVMSIKNTGKGKRGGGQFHAMGAKGVLSTKDGKTKYKKKGDPKKVKKWQGWRSKGTIADTNKSVAKAKKSKKENVEDTALNGTIQLEEPMPAREMMAAVMDGMDPADLIQYQVYTKDEE